MEAAPQSGSKPENKADKPFDLFNAHIRASMAQPRELQHAYPEVKRDAPVLSAEEAEKRNQAIDANMNRAILEGRTGVKVTPDLAAVMPQAAVDEAVAKGVRLASSPTFQAISGGPKTDEPAAKTKMRPS